MKLNLTRPLFVFDLETTGLDVSKDSIVELAYVKLWPNGNRQSATMRIRPVDVLGNQKHISAESSEITGIVDSDLTDCPTFRDIAPELQKTLEDCDLAGFGSNKFDVPLLVEEFLRCRINIDLKDRRFIDVQTIYHKMEKRTLSAAYQFYCHKPLTDAHAALADTEATLEVLEAQLDAYPNDLKNDMDFLAEFSKQSDNIDFAGRLVSDENGRAVVNFGKHKGKLLADVLRREPSFLHWVMQGDFPLNTKQEFQRLAFNIMYPGGKS